MVGSEKRVQGKIEATETWPSRKLSVKCKLKGAIVAAVAIASGCTGAIRSGREVRIVSFYEKTHLCKSIRIVNVEARPSPSTRLLAEAMGEANQKVVAMGGNGMYLISRSVDFDRGSASVTFEALLCDWNKVFDAHPTPSAPIHE